MPIDSELRILHFKMVYIYGLEKYPLAKLSVLNNLWLSKRRFVAMVVGLDMAHEQLHIPSEQGDHEVKSTG